MPEEHFDDALRDPRVKDGLRAIWSVLDLDDLGLRPIRDRIGGFATLLQREANRLRKLVTARAQTRAQRIGEVGEPARRRDEVQDYVRKHGVKSAGDMPKAQTVRGERPGSVAKFKRVRAEVEWRGLVASFRRDPGIPRAWSVPEMEAQLQQRDERIKALERDLARGER